MKAQPWYKTEGVNGELFASQKILAQRVRSIVNPAVLNTPLTGDDERFLLDLLRHHPEWGCKSMWGVSHLEVRMNTCGHFNTRGLWIVAPYGEEIDISWVVATRSNLGSYQASLAVAARHAVVDQIRYVRDTGSKICGICHQTISGPIHVDHQPPNTFQSLLSDFFTCREPGDVLPVLDTGGLHARFADPAVAEGWAEFHGLFAELQNTHPACNMRQGAGQ